MCVSTLAGRPVRRNDEMKQREEKATEAYRGEAVDEKHAKWHYGNSRISATGEAEAMKGRRTAGFEGN